MGFLFVFRFALPASVANKATNRKRRYRVHRGNLAAEECEFRLT